MEEKKTYDHFNTSAEKDTANRMNGYQLNDNERSDVWKIVEKRDQLTKDQKDYFNEQKSNLVNEEYDKLRGAQSPQQNYNLGMSQPQNAVLRGRAEMNVHNNQKNALIDIQRTADENIQRILSNARADGRGPVPNLTNDFNRARDHDR